MVKVYGDIPDEIAVKIIIQLAEQNYRVEAVRGECNSNVIQIEDAPNKWDITARKNL